MKNGHLNFLIPGMVLLMSFMSVGCGYTEEEYRAKVNEAHEYQRLAKQRQTQVMASDKQVKALQEELKSLKEELSLNRAEKKRAQAQQQTNKEHLEVAKMRLKEIEVNLANKKTELEQLQSQLSNQKIAIKNTRATEVQLEELKIRNKKLAQREQELQGREKELLAQIKEVKSQILERDEKIRKEQEVQQQLLATLKKQLESDKIKISELSNRVAVRLDERLLFDSGKAFIKASGFKILNKIGAVLKKIEDKHIQVEGHTDNRPIGRVLKNKFATNWELSVARATIVTRYLVDVVKISPTRISSTGFSSHQPVAENKTPEGRQANRRVEFALLPLRLNERE